ncbi:MAG: endonuclease/exonuclease/phosphatase family protein [Chlorobiaceae bacterium]|nr:endonuclease/exonuclease/phosphatase family protein [Chlorobiaceae bacterium]
MRYRTTVLLTTLLLMLTFIREAACQAGRDPLLILWWNVENLFDTRNDPNTEDDEFTPEGRLHWTDKKLKLKQMRIASVFEGIRENRAYRKYPDIVAFAESENRQIFDGTMAAVDHAGYRTDYHESPDPRGIDIGLAWNPATVRFTGSKPYTVPLGGKRTRFVIAAGFSVSGRPFSVVLNHWPSRAFDAAWSEPKRIEAAKVARHIVDSLRTRNPKAEIIVMGDFNDEPGNNSIRNVLGSSFDRKQVRDDAGRVLFNCWSDLQLGGSYAYKGHWEQIDHILLSAGLLDRSGLYVDQDAFNTFSFPHMFEQSGKKLYPTYEKGKYKGGYSDHLPLLLKVSVGK